MMMRAGEENSITHSKKTTRDAFRQSREKKQMCQYGRKPKTDASPSLLECAHMRSDEKYVLPTRQKIKFTEN